LALIYQASLSQFPKEFRSPQFVLPNPNYGPSARPQGGIHQAVPELISRYFGFPKFSVIRRNNGSCPMSMPEFPIDKNCETDFGENEVGFSKKL
jgi:hypothetical protein